MHDCASCHLFNVDGKIDPLLAIVIINVQLYCVGNFRGNHYFDL
jgi:hypothetical protein